jgi:RNA polymerase sigma-70 factor (ECF subfamily)
MAQTLTMMEQPKDERLEWLYAQIAQLDPVDRSICLLMLEGFTYSEIANLLGISESNVGVKIYRIKRHLVRKSQEIEHHGV